MTILILLLILSGLPALAVVLAGCSAARACEAGMVPPWSVVVDVAPAQARMEPAEVGAVLEDPKREWHSRCRSN